MFTKKITDGGDRRGGASRADGRACRRLEAVGRRVHGRQGHCSARSSRPSSSDDTADASEINVEVNKGIVQLNGFVDNEKEKAQAEAVAKGVAGVKGVQNNLAIKSAGSDGRSADRRLDVTAKVKSALVDSSDTKAGDIKVETKAASCSSPASSTNEAQKTAATKVAQPRQGREVRPEQPEREEVTLRYSTAGRRVKRRLSPCPSPVSRRLARRESRLPLRCSRFRTRFELGRVADRPDPHAVPGVVVDGDALHVRLDALQRELRPHAVRVLELPVRARLQHVGARLRGRLRRVARHDDFLLRNDHLEVRAASRRSRTARPARRRPIRAPRRARSAAALARRLPPGLGSRGSKK